MASTHNVAHALHDVGLAGWFGTTFAGAAALNDAAGTVDRPGERAKVANAGWAKLTPVNLAFIGAHLVGSASLTFSEAGRMARQQGVGSDAALKTALTVAALGATAYARSLGQKVMNAGDVPAEDGTSPTAATPPDAAGAMRQLKVLQWVIPGLTGALLVMGARMSEQYRPSEQTAGLLNRLNPLA